MPGALALGICASLTTVGAAESPGLGLVRADARAGLERMGRLEELPSYEIDQAVDDVTGTLAAHLTLSYTNLTGAALRTLPLLLHPNTAAELGAEAPRGGRLVVTDVRAIRGPAVSLAAVRPRLVEVRFAEAVAPGERVTLSVRYTGRLRVLTGAVNDPFVQALGAMGSLSGSGSADYGLLAVGDGLVTVASAYPMVAPFHEGRFDPGRPAPFGDLAWNGMATFRVRTVVPAGLTVVTNLVDRPARALSDGGVVVLSEGTPVRDFVLVAGRDLERRSQDVGATRVTSLFRRRDEAAGQQVLEAAAGALASFERRFGPYPYTELDVVQASLTGGAGGVEFSGMVLIAAMLYRSPADSPSPVAALLRLLAGVAGRQIPGGSAGLDPAAGPGGHLLEGIREFTVAHEVAHQYFAGIVGNDSHRAAWVDEPLAQYAAALAVEDSRGPAAARQAMDRNVKLNYAVYRLLGGVDRPVLRDTPSFRSPLEYAALVYGKAPYLYVALRQSLGEARLHGAIRAAIDQHRFRIVSREEWVTALEEHAGGPGSGVRPAFRRWLEETRGDEDLAIDASGDFVLDAVFPPGIAATLRRAPPGLGMTARDLLRALLGGAIQDDAPVGPGIDPEAALQSLERDRRTNP